VSLPLRSVASLDLEHSPQSGEGFAFQTVVLGSALAGLIDPLHRPHNPFTLSRPRGVRLLSAHSPRRAVDGDPVLDEILLQAAVGLPCSRGIAGGGVFLVWIVNARLLARTLDGALDAF